MQGQEAAANDNWGESDSDDDVAAAAHSEELSAAGNFVWKQYGKKPKDNGKLKSWKLHSCNALANRRWPGFGSAWAPKDAVRAYCDC